MNKKTEMRVSTLMTTLVLLLAIGLAGCTPSPTPPPPPKPVTDPAGPIDVRAGNKLAVKASAEGATDYEWELYGDGEISPKRGETTLYTAPEQAVSGGAMAILNVVASNAYGESPPTSLEIHVVPLSLCPPDGAEGTVPPTVTISSLVFVVNGGEQVVDDFGWLQASSGDQVEVREVTICTESFKGSGGRVYVEFAPVDQYGQVITSEITGTMGVAVAPDLKSIPSNISWTIGNWRQISVVTVHYPPGGGTLNPNCEPEVPYICEVDDRMIVPVQ